MLYKEVIKPACRIAHAMQSPARTLMALCEFCDLDASERPTGVWTAEAQLREDTALEVYR